LKELKAVLVLSDGSVFFGKGFGAQTTSVGELVFTTNITGYPESLSDPSYAGQILLSTYPLIGNYGIKKEWQESERIWVEGFVVRELCQQPYHRNIQTVDKILKEHNIPGITGLDTRAITKKIREAGVMPAAISVFEKEQDINELIKLAKELNYSNINFVEKVSTKKVEFYGKGKRVVLIDYGVKRGIINELIKRNCEVIVVPYNISAEEVLSFEPKGIVASNGPGDPAIMQKESQELKKLFDYPMLGICLGHQLIGQAAGAKTYKLKFGHRGGNHSVLDIKKNKIVITTQNHGFAIDEKSLKGTDFEITHKNLIDGTIEGIAHKELKIFSVQYHPEACPGPHDSKYLFDEFLKMI
jgi:carbamoyl-phosphate synthase small subunit